MSVSQKTKKFYLYGGGGKPRRPCGRLHRVAHDVERGVAPPQLGNDLIYFIYSCLLYLISRYLGEDVDAEGVLQPARPLPGRYGLQVVELVGDLLVGENVVSVPREIGQEHKSFQRNRFGVRSDDLKKGHAF